jgi:hypothetical protein
VADNHHKTLLPGRVSRSLSNVKNAVNRLLEAYRGSPESRRKHRAHLASLPTIQEGIQNLERRFAHKPDAPTDAPVFILSSGWRTGSTLVQRLVMSSKKILVWGEPYAYSGYVRRLADSLLSFTPEYPFEMYLLRTHQQRGLDTDAWVANLYPNPESVLQAHRRFFQALFAEPAAVEGWPSWGIKATRLEHAHALYLKWLFPRAKFLYVYRNPFDAYRSYHRFHKQIWYESFPNRPVLTPAAFGKHWQKLLKGFLTGHQEVNGLLVRYEDLCAGRLSVEHLADYLQLDLNAEVLSIRITSRRANRDLYNPPIPAAALRILRRAVEPLASELGYKA